MTFDEEKKQGSQVDLGDLGFKAEDFEGHLVSLVHTLTEEEFIQELNRILEEKLERAPEVFGKIDKLGSAWSSKNLRAFNDTHQARLVCVELLGKSE